MAETKDLSGASACGGSCRRGRCGGGLSHTAELVAAGSPCLRIPSAGGTLTWALHPHSHHPLLSPWRRKVREADWGGGGGAAGEARGCPGRCEDGAGCRAERGRWVGGASSGGAAFRPRIPCRRAGHRSWLAPRACRQSGCQEAARGQRSNGAFKQHCAMHGRHGGHRGVLIQSCPGGPGRGPGLRIPRGLSWKGCDNPHISPGTPVHCGVGTEQIQTKSLKRHL